MQLGFGFSDFSVPSGFRHQPDFIDAREEQALVQLLHGFAYEPYVMRGQASKREVRFFGAGASAEAGTPEVLDARTARGEAAFLALRCAEGLDAARFRSEFGAAPRGFWDREIDALVAGELLCEAPDGSLRLTRRGRLVSDGVFEYFV